MLLKPQLHVQDCAYVRMQWLTNVGHNPCAQAEGYFGQFISKNRFLLIKKVFYIYIYIFYFNTPQVNLKSNWALNWPWALEFEHHWGTGVQVVRGTKCGVYRMRRKYPQQFQTQPLLGKQELDYLQTSWPRPLVAKSSQIKSPSLKHP